MTKAESETVISAIKMLETGRTSLAVGTLRRLLDIAGVKQPAGPSLPDLGQLVVDDKPKRGRKR